MNRQDLAAKLQDLWSFARRDRLIAAGQAVDVSPGDRSTFRWVAPDGWPQPADDWAPTFGWRPDPQWPAAPEGWVFWQPIDPSPLDSTDHSAPAATGYTGADLPELAAGVRRNLEAYYAQQQPGRVSSAGAGSDWVSAEVLAAAALRKFGFDDARTTGSGTDAGIDVAGRSIACQVKYTVKPVGRPVLQQLVGASGGRVTAFFSRAGYTAQAIEYADQVGMALFGLTLPSRVSPQNSAARQMAS